MCTDSSIDLCCATSVSECALTPPLTYAVQPQSVNVHWLLHWLVLCNLSQWMCTDSSIDLCCATSVSECALTPPLTCAVQPQSVNVHWLLHWLVLCNLSQWMCTDSSIDLCCATSVSKCALTPPLTCAVQPQSVNVHWLIHWLVPVLACVLLMCSSFGLCTDDVHWILHWLTLVLACVMQWRGYYLGDRVDLFHGRQSLTKISHSGKSHLKWDRANTKVTSLLRIYSHWVSSDVSVSLDAGVWFLMLRRLCCRCCWHLVWMLPLELMNSFRALMMLTFGVNTALENPNYHLRRAAKKIKVTFSFRPA